MSAARGAVPAKCRAAICFWNTLCWHILTALLWTERINLSKRIVSSTTGTTGPAQIHAPQSPLAVTSHRRNYAWACAEVITDVLLSSCGSRCTSSYFVQSAKSQAQITVVTDLQTEPQISIILNKANNYINRWKFPAINRWNANQAKRFSRF